MRTLLTIGLVTLAIGCNSDPNCRRETALLRSEILDVEDKYYAAKAERDKALAELKAFRGEGDILNIEPGEIICESDSLHAPIIEGPVIRTESRTGPPNHPSPRSRPSNGSRWDASPGNPQLKHDLPAPETILPGGTQDTHSPNNSHSILEDKTSQIKVIPSEMEAEPSPSTVPPPSSRIARVSIDSRQTEGADVDGEPGDEGVNLMIRTRSRTGRTILEPGKLTVSILDPAESPDRQRIGLWKFLPEETALFQARDTENHDGILLHLPWDQAIPTHRELVIFVRFETEDGQQYQSSSTIKINPPRQSYQADAPLVVRWTQNDERWDRYLSPMTGRQKVPVLPASTTIKKKPQWRPVR